MSPARTLRLFANSVIVERDVFTRAPTEQVTAHAVGHHALVLLTHRVTPRIAMETNSIQALTEIVRHTPLATVLPDSIAHQHPHLSAVALDPPFPIRTVALLTREGAFQTAATRAFTRLTHDYVRTHLTNNPWRVAKRIGS